MPRASRPACASGSRRPAITTAAGISPARSAPSPPARRAAQAARARRATDDACARHRRHAVGRACSRTAAPCASRSTPARRRRMGCSPALLAQQGFDSSEEIVEGKRGFARIYSNVATPELVLDRTRHALGDRAQRLQALCLRRGAASDPRRDGCARRAARARARRRSPASRRACIRSRCGSPGSAIPRPGCNRNSAIYHAGAVAYLDRGCRHRAVLRRAGVGAGRGRAARQDRGDDRRGLRARTRRRRRW